MPSPEQKRTWKEKTADVAFSALSVGTLPIWLTAGFSAAVVGSWWTAGGFGLLAASDGVTIKETFQKEKSILNPSYWMDRVFRGRNRLGANKRLA
jgi:hypothetical protein